ncbi:MAG: hypothetical protein WCF57_04200 [Pyrinomonadaceae bacterium]
MRDKEDAQRNIVKQVANDTGVPVEQVEKVLKGIGLDAAFANAASLVKHDQLSSLKSKDVRVSLRVANALYHS